MNIYKSIRSNLKENDLRSIEDSVRDHLDEDYRALQKGSKFADWYAAFIKNNTDDEINDIVNILKGKGKITSNAIDEAIKEYLNESDSYELLCDCYSCGETFCVPLKDNSNVQQLIANSQESDRSISVRDAKRLNIVCPNCKSSEVSIIQVDPLNESEEDWEDDDMEEPEIDYGEGVPDEPYERFIDDVLTMDYDELVEKYGKASADEKWRWFNKDGSHKQGSKIQYEMLCPDCNNKFYLTTYSKKKNTDEAFSNVDPSCPNCKHNCTIDNIKSTSSWTSDIDDNEIKESEEGNINANNIIVKFEQSDRNNRIYFRALTLISQLENENYITKDEYDMYIDKLNKLYVEGRKN